jgi:FkbM family methyltransferase
MNTLVTPGGITLAYANKAETDFVYSEIFEERVYLRNGIELGDGAVVFDIGANIGLFTIFIQEHFKNARVFAFEPSPEIYELLRFNTARYGDRVVCHPCGVAGETRQDTFTFYPSYSIISGFHADHSNNRETLRRGVINQWHERRPGQPDPDDRLIDALVDAALKDRREYTCQLTGITEVIVASGVPEVSLLKIDAEGSELEILDGLTPMVWPMIRQVVMEIHAGVQAAARVEAIFVREGFRVVLREEKGLRSSGVVNCYARRP